MEQEQFSALLTHEADVADQQSSLRLLGEDLDTFFITIFLAVFVLHGIVVAVQGSGALVD